MSQSGMSDDPVDQANRFAIVVVALVLMFAAVLVVLLAWGDAASAIGRLRDFAGYLDRHDTRESKVIVSLGAAVIMLLLLALIVIEVTPSPLQKMRLRKVRSGNATITTPEIAARIEAEARAVEHVQECQAIVAAHGRRIEVVLDLHVDAGADLARAADETCGRVSALVEQRIGVELAQPPRARLHYRELRLRDEPPLPDTMRGPGPAWGPPASAESTDEGDRDGRAGSTDAPEEAQA